MHPERRARCRDAQQRVTLVADTRSNSVLVRGDNASRVRARALADRAARYARAASAGNIFIIYLKNADATRVAQTLRALFSGGGDDGPATPRHCATLPGLEHADHGGTRRHRRDDGSE